MTVEADIDFVTKYIRPLQSVYLEDSHNMFRTVISYSSFRSRYGEPICREAIEPTKELFKNIDEHLHRRVSHRIAIKHEFSMMIFLGKPMYSVNQRLFGFMNNNYGYFPEGITIFPKECGGESDIQNLFDNLEAPEESNIIVEKVHVKKIQGSMPTASDYIIRRFKADRFTNRDVIYLSNSDKDK